MMADLVGDDISIGEIAAAAIFRLHLVEEGHVEIDLLVDGAVERPHRGARFAAAGLPSAVKGLQFHVFVGDSFLRGQDVSPHVLGLAENDFDEVQRRIVRRGPL